MGKMDNFDGSTMPFGKYEGLSIEFIVKHEVDYARWIITQDWLSRDIALTIECEIDDQYPDVVWKNPPWNFDDKVPVWRKRLKQVG